jgi:hypothetical protein
MSTSRRLSSVAHELDAVETSISSTSAGLDVSRTAPAHPTNEDIFPLISEVAPIVQQLDVVLDALMTCEMKLQDRLAKMEDNLAKLEALAKLANPQEPRTKESYVEETNVGEHFSVYAEALSGEAVFGAKVGEDEEGSCKLDPTNDRAPDMRGDNRTNRETRRASHSNNEAPEDILGDTVHLRNGRNIPMTGENHGSDTESGSIHDSSDDSALSKA